MRQAGGKAQRDDPAGVGGVDDAVVPQPRAGIIRMALALVTLADRSLERSFVGGAGEAARFDRGQHRRRLFAAHDADPGVRPHPQEPRRESATAHAVVAGTKAAAGNDGDFRHRGTGDGGDHLRAMFGDALILIFAADHETGDVLQEQQGYFALAAQLDEMRALLCALRKQDAVVGDDANRHSLDPRETGNQRRPVQGLELIECAVVDQARDDLASRLRLTGIGRNQPVQIRCGEARR